MLIMMIKVNSFFMALYLIYEYSLQILSRKYKKKVPRVPEVSKVLRVLEFISKGEIFDTQYFDI